VLGPLVVALKAAAAAAASLEGEEALSHCPPTRVPAFSAAADVADAAVAVPFISVALDTLSAIGCLKGDLALKLAAYSGSSPGGLLVLLLVPDCSPMSAPRGCSRLTKPSWSKPSLRFLKHAKKAQRATEAMLSSLPTYASILYEHSNQGHSNQAKSIDIPPRISRENEVTTIQGVFTSHSRIAVLIHARA
jgi:hypothetical protein